jgi:endonuclease YncB( thermonuclease family)
VSVQDGDTLTVLVAKQQIKVRLQARGRDEPVRIFEVITDR